MKTSESGQPAKKSIELPSQDDIHRLCQEMKPVRRGADGALHYLHRNGDPSAEAVLSCRLADLVAGRKAEGLVEVGRFAIILPQAAEDVTAAVVQGQLLVKIFEGNLSRTEKAVAFELNDFDKHFTYLEYGGLVKRGQVTVYVKKEDAEPQKTSR
jgi:hypothetical protein